MSKKRFTKEEVEILKNNKYVKSVSDKAITYTEEFKRILVHECLKQLPTRIVFEKYGFDPDVLGADRMSWCRKSWTKNIKNQAPLV